MSISDSFTSERIQFTATTDNRVRPLIDAVTLLVVSTAGALFIPEGARIFLVGFGIPDNLAGVVIGGSLATLATGVVALAYLRFVHRMRIPLRQPSRREWLWVAGATIAAILVIIVVDVLAAALGVIGGESATTQEVADAPLALLMYGVVWAIVAIGPIEELLFRGIIQGRLREAFGPASAIGITSLAFALVHLPVLFFGGVELASLAALFSLAGLGAGAIIAGAVYELTANLAVVALAHGLTDATLFVLIFLLT